MFLTYDEELQRAEERQPFATSAEGFAWLAKWCETCVHERRCPLIDLAVMEQQTPFGWIRVDSNNLPYQFLCTEYESVAVPAPTEASR